MGLNVGAIVAGGTLNATGVSEGHQMGGPFTVLLGAGWTGSVSVEVSGDEGANYVNALMPDGTPNAWTVPGSITLPHVFGPRLMFRLNWTRLTGSLPWSFVR